MSLTLSYYNSLHDVNLFVCVIIYKAFGALSSVDSWVSNETASGGCIELCMCICVFVQGLWDRTGHM